MICPLLSFGQSKQNDDMYGINDSDTKGRIKGKKLDMGSDSVNRYLDGYSVVGKSLIYTAVYEMPELKQAQIKDLLIKTFSNVPSISIVQASLSDDQFVSSFTDHRVDIKKYGGSWGTTQVWVQQSNNGVASFQVKDGKYRVIIKDVKIVIDSRFSWSFNTDFVKNNGDIRNTDSESGRKAYYYFARSMYDLFDVKNHKTTDW